MLFRSLLVKILAPNLMPSYSSPSKNYFLDLIALHNAIYKMHSNLIAVELAIKALAAETFAADSSGDLAKQIPKATEFHLVVVLP